MHKLLAINLVLFGVLMGAGAVLLSGWPPAAQAQERKLTPVTADGRVKQEPKAELGETCKRWEVRRQKFGISIPTNESRRLEAGWEPFAVQGNMLWQRRCVE